MSLVHELKDADKLTANGRPRRLFVSDFHETLADGEGVRRDYFKALVMMHLAGHKVVIASGDHANAQDELSQSDVVQSVLDELALTPEELDGVYRDVLNVTDKLDLIRSLKESGFMPYPDIFCDDMQPSLPAKYHLYPCSEEYDGFCVVAAIDPDLALTTLLNDPDMLNAGYDVDITSVQQHFGLD